MGVHAIRLSSVYLFLKGSSWLTHEQSYTYLHCSKALRSVDKRHRNPPGQVKVSWQRAVVQLECQPAWKPGPTLKAK